MRGRRNHFSLDFTNHARIVEAMLAKRVIPCLDVTDGRVVKGTKFLNLRDAGDPVECAKMYDRQGADELVFLDITASSDGRATMVSVVERTAEQCFMPLTVGGGIRAVEDFRTMLRAGADKVSVNTSALQRPELISEAADAFGSQCVVVAVDGACAPGDVLVVDLATAPLMALTSLSTALTSRAWNGCSAPVTRPPARAPRASGSAASSAAMTSSRVPLRCAAPSAAPSTVATAASTRRSASP
jgi:hypothetical protein